MGSSARHMDVGVGILEERFGAADLKSEVVAFDYSEYYNAEMGEGILRQFLSFEGLIYPGLLANIKVATNQMEREHSEGSSRRINIDPGYLTEASLILATTKPGSYRVYLGEEIYAQPTLRYVHKGFCPYEWTYNDYRDERHIDFFNRVREKYRHQLSSKSLEKK